MSTQVDHQARTLASLKYADLLVFAQGVVVQDRGMRQKNVNQRQANDSLNKAHVRTLWEREKALVDKRIAEAENAALRETVDELETKLAEANRELARKPRTVLKARRAGVAAR